MRIASQKQESQKMEKRKKVSVHLKVDEEIWTKTQAVIDEMGFTQSGFVELLFKQFIQAETVPMGQVIGEILQDVLASKMKTKKRARS